MRNHLTVPASHPLHLQSVPSQRATSHKLSAFLPNQEELASISTQRHALLGLRVEVQRRPLLPGMPEQSPNATTWQNFAANTSEALKIRDRRRCREEVSVVLQFLFIASRPHRALTGPFGAATVHLHMRGYDVVAPCPSSWFDSTEDIFPCDVLVRLLRGREFWMQSRLLVRPMVMRLLAAHQPFETTRQAV